MTRSFVRDINRLTPFWRRPEGIIKNNNEGSKTMDREDFIRQISALRRGELRLEPPEHNGLSRFAGAWLEDLKKYVSALESGYRKATEELDRYSRARCGAGGPTMGGLIRNQWSDEAALGYAWMACIEAAVRPDLTVMILESMGRILGEISREDAAEAHRSLIKRAGGKEFGGTE